MAEPPKEGKKTVNSKYIHVPKNFPRGWSKTNVFQSLAHHLSWRHIIDFKETSQLQMCLWVWETDVWQSQRQVEMLGNYFFNYWHISLYKGEKWTCALYFFPQFRESVHFVYPTCVWNKYSCFLFLHKVSICTILHLATFTEYILEHGVSAHKKHPKSFHICRHFIVSVHHILSKQT